MNSEKIFLINGDWQDIKGRNTLSLFGINKKGKVVKLIIDNVKPVCFIENNIEITDINFPITRKPLKLKTFNNKKVDALYFNTQHDLLRTSEILRSKNIKLYEDDIDPLRRYLMERFINAQAKIAGDFYEQNDIVVYHNPTIKKIKIEPSFKILSLDIETGKDQTLYSIAVHVKNKNKETKKVFMLAKEKHKRKSEVFFFASEKALLEGFLEWFARADPDIIIGWHIIGFDLMFLQKKALQLKVPFTLSRDGSAVKLRQTKTGNYFAYIAGRAVLDGPFLLRSSFYTFEDFKLETVSQELLGTGKTITPEQNKVVEIERLFKNDKKKLAEYNLQDAILVTKIFETTGLIDLCVKRSELSGLLIENLSTMVIAFEHFYLPLIHRKGYVVNSLSDIIRQGHAAGGYVFEPEPGIYNDVIVCDFKSLYPSIIRTFKIDPLSQLLSEIDTIKTPTGLEFSGTQYILPNFIEELMGKREKAKREGNKYLSQAIKILMNSFYGVMGSYKCRFYHPNLPSGITGTGHWLLLDCKEYLEAKGYKVVYGDTDSLFIKLKEDVLGKYNIGKELVEELNDYLSEKLQQDFGVTSYLELEYEKHYKKFVVIGSRNSKGGAKKRYAGLLTEGGEEKIDFVGMEAVRSDWTKLAKEFQEKLYYKIFKNEEIEEWLRNLVNKIKAGVYDEKLIYKKRLRKNIEDYSKNIPPQVKAAKLINRKTGYVKYVITKRGAVPIELNISDIDYEHYISKQIKPIADSILTLLEKSFDKIVNENQLKLFK